MKEDFPRVQWSRFRGASREEQWVIRGDSITEVLDMKADLQEKLQETETIDDVLDEAADATHKCKVCGKQLTFRTGINKAGKAWKGWFCEDKSHEPQWER